MNAASGWGSYRHVITPSLLYLRNQCSHLVIENKSHPASNKTRTTNVVWIVSQVSYGLVLCFFYIAKCLGVAFCESDSKRTKCQALSDIKTEEQAITYLANNPHDVCGSSMLLLVVCTQHIQGLVDLFSMTRSLHVYM